LNQEYGDDAMVPYFDGTNIYKPFGKGQDDSFLDIKARIRQEMDNMPLNLKTVKQS
jgi:hypothetical protein